MIIFHSNVIITVSDLNLHPNVSSSNTNINWHRTWLGANFCTITQKWRGWWDFGTGALGDIGCHYFDPVFRALNLGAPVSVEASSTRVNEETFPLGSMVTWHFPKRGEMAPVKLVWYDGGLRPARPEGIPAVLVPSRQS